MDLHVFPIPIPPSAFLPIPSLWVIPGHQPRALVSCILGLTHFFTDSALLCGFQRCLCPSPISHLLDGPSFYISSFLWRERLGTCYSGYGLAVPVVLHLRTQAQ